MTLTHSQKTTLAAMLDDEVASQLEDPTMPWALDEARELCAALDRGDELVAWPLARILAEARRQAARVVAAADLLAQLH